MLEVSIFSHLRPNDFLGSLTKKDRMLVVDIVFPGDVAVVLSPLGQHGISLWRLTKVY